MITFYTWLKQFKGENGPRGDLAGDMLGDSTFPRTKNYNKILEYLESVYACDAALFVFKKSFSQYQKENSDI